MQLHIELKNLEPKIQNRLKLNLGLQMEIKNSEKADVQEEVHTGLSIGQDVASSFNS